MAAAPFDGNDYRKRVLAVIEARGGPQTSDPFEYYDLPLEQVGRSKDAAVGAQVDAVWAFWQKQRDHPKYRGLVTALLADHDEVAPLLRSRDTREELAESARRLRAHREQARFAELDAAIDRLVDRFGGIPRGKLEGLRRLAAGAGLDGPQVEDRISRRPVLDDVTPGALPGVPPSVYRQVRGDLDELGRILGAAPPASLYDLLGLPPGASRVEVRAERETAAARNRELRPDRRRALVDDLLAAVTALLVDGDADAYLDAVAADVTARLRPRVVAAVLVEDELTTDDQEHLLQEARSAGLDHERAVRVLAELARESGVRAPQPRTERAPRSRSGAPREPDRPPAGSQPAPPGARDVDAVLAEAAQHWRTVEQALAARRFTEAAVALERLVGIAPDLSSPRGTSVAAALAQARAGLDAAGSSLAAAKALSGVARELALLEAVSLAPDHEGLLSALRETGVAPPTGVRAEIVDGGVRVSWQRSISPGVVDYKVRRSDGRAVGTTPGTDLEDALSRSQVPLPTYVVVARRAGVTSVEASSAATTGPTGPTGPTAAVPPTVTSLVVLPMGRRLRLTFPPPPSGRAEVWRLLDSVVAPRPGTPVLDTGSLGVLVPGMGPGLAVDRRPSTPFARYLVVTVADTAVAGAVATYVDTAPVTSVRAQADRLHWQWPPGCTEVLVAWRRDGPPLHAHDPAATTTKTTNSRYEIEDGLPLPPERPLHVAVFSAARVEGTLCSTNLAPPGARLVLIDEADGSDAH